METVSFLLSAGCKGSDALVRASANGHVHVATFLLSHGYDIHASGRCNPHSPVDHAIRANEIAMLNYLIKAGADVNALNAIGETGMYTAVVGNCLDGARILIANGCNVNTLHPGRFFGFFGTFISIFW